MSLTGKTKAASYKDILQMNNSNSGVDTTARTVVDGEGTASVISLSDDVLRIKPQNDDSLAVLSVRDKDNNLLLTVDSSNDVVKAGIGQHIVNTQYAYFGVNVADSANFATNTHYPIPFNANGYGNGSPGNFPDFGTGTDPTLTFTTAEANSDRASDLVPVLWRVPDDITIDEIKHFEGSDTANGDDIKFSVMSYAVNSANGATSGDLSDGTEHLISSAVIPSAGLAQAYYQSLAAGAAGYDVDSGRIVMACVAQDGVQSDLTVNMQLIYHLR